MKNRYKRFYIAIGGLAILCLLLCGYLFVWDKSETSEEKETMKTTVIWKNDTMRDASDTDVKRIALTFDDGPHPVYTPMLLEGLKKRDVKVSFFLLGKAAEEYPDIVKEMHDQGHLIGNHTYHHVDIKDADADMIEKEVVSANELIEEITGQYPQFIRPPFGQQGNGIEDTTGMICVMWDVDPLDWCTTDASLVVERVLTHAEDDCIILMHDQYKSSVQAAFTIVDALQKQGYEFVTVDELLLD